MKLTKEQVEKMLPGQTLTIVCNDASELNSSYEIAKRTRREGGIRTDGLYISCSTKTMTVVLRRMEKGAQI